jgi:large subunit ribosomal protein L9
MSQAHYLLPRKLALLVTEGNKQQIERERSKFEAREQEEKKVADAMAGRLAGVEIQIARKVGETEALYGSVTSADIADAMLAKGFEIDRRRLNLREPIKKLGMRHSAPSAPRCDRPGQGQGRRGGFGQT